MSSLLQTEMRRTYAAQRGVSQGAAITLAAVSAGFSARFECAERCKEILGDRHYIRLLGPPKLFIPLEDAHKSITKLAETYSVALVDTVTDEQGSRFVLVWKIPAMRKGCPEVEDFITAVAAAPNQGGDDTFSNDLDAY